MKRNVIAILAAALLIVAGLSFELAPGIPSEVYLSEILTESELEEPVPEEPDDIVNPDTPDNPELEYSDDELDGVDESGYSDAEFDEPESESEASEADSSVSKEIDTEESGGIFPEIEDNAGINGTQTDMMDISDASEDNAETELEPDSSENAEEESAEEAVPEPAANEFIAQYLSLSASEAVVKTHTDLKNALANDNGITTVYLGANITLQSGIKINPKKAAVVIDGFNPLEPGQSKPYTLTDIDSVSFYDTIYVDEAGTKSIHVRDLMITGKNYYGPFSVYDMDSLAGFVITYERVNYNGPQLGYNRRGTVRLIDCSTKIHGNNGILSPSQEFSEVKHLVFENTNTIDTSSSGYSVFWHPFGGSFTVDDDASLTVTSPNTSTAFGVFFADSYLYDIDISIGSRAVFDATISGIAAPEVYSTITGLTVHEGGAFYLRTTKAATAAVLRMGGPLIVEKDAKFVISGYGGSSYPVLRQENGDIMVGKDAVFQIVADNPYTSLINLIGSAFICDDPLSVLLVNARRDIQASLSAGRVSVDAQQVNYWNVLSSGGFDDPPLYKWTKTDKTNVEIDGILAYGVSADFSAISSNHVPSDPPGISPNATTFSMAGARVLAFGRLELIVSAPTEQSTVISGVTEAGAKLRASFEQQGVTYELPEVTADSEGSFRIPVGVGLQSGTVVKVKGIWQYLTAEAEVTVSGAEEGHLELFVPDVLEFYTTRLSSRPKTVRRLNPEWKIVVSDTRTGDGKWSLYARLDGDLFPDNASLPALKDALIFVRNDRDIEIMYPGSDILIFRQTSESGEDIFPVDWDDNKGVLLNVKPGAAFSHTLYTASVAWTIVDGV